MCLLGPSGCGKTTLLRLIAGLDAPSEGRILLDGEDITAVPAHQRNFGMVFQSLALFPHLSVADNISYGLRVRGVAAAARRKRAESIAGTGSFTGHRRSSRGTALRRPAATGRHRPRTGSGTEDLSVGRAHVCPGCQAAGSNASGAEPASAAPGHNYRGGDPRSARGHDHGRHHRRHRCQSGAAGGCAAGHLPPAPEQLSWPISSAP